MTQVQLKFISKTYESLYIHAHTYTYTQTRTRRAPYPDQNKPDAFTCHSVVIHVVQQNGGSGGEVGICIKSTQARANVCQLQHEHLSKREPFKAIGWRMTSWALASLEPNTRLPSDTSQNQLR